MSAPKAMATQSTAGNTPIRVFYTQTQRSEASAVSEPHFAIVIFPQKITVKKVN